MLFKMNDTTKMDGRKTKNARPELCMRLEITFNLHAFFSRAAPSLDPMSRRTRAQRRRMRISIRVFIHKYISLDVCTVLDSYNNLIVYVSPSSLLLSASVINSRLQI